MIETYPMGSRPTFIHLHALRATPRSNTPHTVRSYFGEFKQKKKSKLYYRNDAKVDAQMIPECGTRVQGDQRAR